VLSNKIKTTIEHHHFMTIIELSLVQQWPFNQTNRGSLPLLYNSCRQSSLFKCIMGVSSSHCRCITNFWRWSNSVWHSSNCSMILLLVVESPCILTSFFFSPPSNHTDNVYSKMSLQFVKMCQVNDVH
jgi:hypothetical protein